MIQYPIETAQMQMATLIVFYLFVYMYLEAVTPNEYGIASHPLLCINRNRGDKKKKIENIDNGEEIIGEEDEKQV